jgi:hypothetical protein
LGYERTRAPVKSRGFSLAGVYQVFLLYILYPLFFGVSMTYAKFVEPITSRMKTRYICLPHLKLSVLKNLPPGFTTFTYTEIANKKLKMKPSFRGNASTFRQVALFAVHGGS